MSKIAIIYGSSRPSKVGKTVAEWFASQVETGTNNLDMIDLAEVNLPMLAEPMPPMMGQYSLESTKQWAKRIENYDGFIFVVAEYNHGYTPILKNAIDHLYAEWGGKNAAIISYGAGPTSHAGAQLKQVLEHIKLKLSDKTFHVSPSHEAISQTGLDSTKVAGDSAQSIFDSIS
jgi:NAD(P)H-dependent FMN reductase